MGVSGQDGVVLFGSALMVLMSLIPVYILTSVRDE